MPPVVIKGQAELQKAYQDERVASEYVDRRFTEPLGALLHARQVRVVQDLIRRQGITEAVELAPGPARLSVDILPRLAQATLVDASGQMLAEARRRLNARALAGRARFVQADVFQLPLRHQVGLVYSFRLIRHFERADRLRIYSQAAGMLNPGGWLVFDAVNETVSAPLRARSTAGEYAHFDALLRPGPLEEELRAAGFTLVALHGVQRHYAALAHCQIHLAPRSAVLARAAMEVIDRLGGEPLEWVVVCRRG
jgi:ubiquinone/menaquinone biosynthesis C-methylase UbiE